MRFLCDAMLGGLAKWLRAAGYDTYYASQGPDTSDRYLTQKALDEGRALLTGDGGFLERKPVRDGHVAFLRVPHRPVEEQLRLVVDSFGLVRRGSRCMECNGELEVVPPEAVAHRVPGGVAGAHEEFFLCGGCDRVFWRGSHWVRIGAAWNGRSGRGRPRSCCVSRQKSVSGRFSGIRRPRRSPTRRSGPHEVPPRPATSWTTTG